MKLDRQKHSLKFVSSSGNPMHPVKHGIVKEDGTIELIVDRLENTDDIIDSYRPSTEIYNIMARIQSGDISLLNKKDGFYGDVTEMPKTYAEMLDLMHRGEEFFNKLPASVKAEYNNDFNQFFADFDNAMSKLLPKEQKELEEIVEPVKEEVKE